MGRRGEKKTQAKVPTLAITTNRFTNALFAAFLRALAPLREAVSRKGAKPQRELNLSSSLDRLEHGDLVGEVEFGADGDAHGDARHFDAERLDELRKVDGG